MPTPDVAAPGPQTRIDPSLERRLAIIGQSIRWLAVLYSLIVLGDALFDWFGGSLPEGPAPVREITPSSAIGLVLLSSAALLAGDTSRTADHSPLPRRIGLALGWVTAIFGLFLMLTFVFGWDWPWWADNRQMPAFTVGVNLFALGLAVPLSVSRIDARVIGGQVATLLVFSLAGTIFVGYAFGEASVGRLFVQPEISFQAAVGALVIAAGVVLMRPGSGVLSITASPSTGGKLLRRVGLPLLLAPAFLLFVVEGLPASERIDALAVVAVSMGFLLVILLGLLARVVDVTAIEASNALAQAERAREGLDQEAPLVSILANTFHDVSVGDLDGWDVATRFRPAEGVLVGDASAVRKVDDRRIGVVLVDVTGHGVDPAIRSVRIRDLLIHALALGRGPGEALGTVTRSIRDDELATAVVVCVEVDTGHVVMASAGHPPVAHVGTQSTVLHSATGPLLFLSDDSIFEEVELDLAQGDTLVLFSDGIADVQISSNGRTAPEQLADILLSEGGSAARTAEMVLGFGENDPSDDQSVVVIRRTT